jgi:phage terminase large subunit
VNDFVYKPTLAFWKIQKLIKEGLPKFKDNQQKVFVIQGGQGAGKTIAILMLIIDYVERNKSEVTICSAELSKLKDTALNDYIKIMQDYNYYNDKRYNKSETLYTYGAGHFVEFLGLDKKDVGKGRRRKIVYINEANKTTLQQYTDITARSDLVIIDYNPDGYFYGTDLINDFNFINLTYLDNEYLSKNEIRNILAYYEKGYDDEGCIKNQFWANKWRVYGKGEIGSVEGRVFLDWKRNTFQDFQKLPFKSFFGVDWGKNHKFGIVELKYDSYTNTLYCHQRNYFSENELLAKLEPIELANINNEGGIIIHTFRKLGIPFDADIVCDSAVPDNILLLRDYGWEYAVGIDKPKGSVMAGITLLQSTNVVYTDVSDGIDLEFKNYSYANDRLGVVDDEVIKAFDDIIDPIRYGRRFIENN